MVRIGRNVAVSAVAFSPEGRMLVSGGLDGTASVWDVGSGKELRRLEGHGRGVRCVTLSSDGRTLVTGGLDGAVKVWDLATGQLRATLKGPGDAVMSVAFSPDGRFLAAAGGSEKAGQVLLWSVGAPAAAPPPGKARGPVGRLDRLLDELLKSGRSDDQIVEALYLATLTRLPTEAEKKPILAHLRRKERREAFRDALWTLVNSREFVENLKEWSRMNPGNVGEFLKYLNQQSP
jgi:hypothetical protein